MSDAPSRVLGLVLTLGALVCANLALLHWMRTERAMRRHAPLPFNFSQPILWAALCALAVGLVVAEIR